MKKFLFNIIAVLLLANLFAPLSIIIGYNTAEASSGKLVTDDVSSVNLPDGTSQILISTALQWSPSPKEQPHIIVFVLHLGSTGAADQEILQNGGLSGENSPSKSYIGKTDFSGFTTVTGLLPNTKYYVGAVAFTAAPDNTSYKSLVSQIQQNGATRATVLERHKGDAGINDWTDSSPAQYITVTTPRVGDFKNYGNVNTTKAPNPIQITPTAPGSAVSSDYTLLAPIGTMKTFKTNDIGVYFNMIFKLAIGLCVAIAVVMIVISGIQYMGDESVFSKTEAKSKITGAILGILIAIGSYALLNTINPALLGTNGLSIAPANIALESVEFIPQSTYEGLTGLKLKSPSEYDASAKIVAAKIGIPYCALRVILQEESSGNPGAIGFDSDVPNGDIGSRKDFIASKQKYSGASFQTTASSITDNGLKNDDKDFIKSTKAGVVSISKNPGLGLDWRFSHGIGLTQTTCFPNSKAFDQRNNLPSCVFAGTSYTPLDLLNPDKNLEAGARLWSSDYKSCKGDVFKTWKAYSGGGCESINKWSIDSATKRTGYYKTCLTQYP